MILLKIAICDDNLLFMKKLERILNENLDYIDIKIFLNVYDLLEQIESYDILFLDYEMPLLNGIEILEKIKNNSIRKIMISNYDNIVFSTYEYNLYWFVRKTHLDNDIHRMFNKLKKDLVNENKKLKIHSYNKSLILAFDEIIYIETEGNYICIVTKNQKYRIRSTFHSIVKQFDNLFYYAYIWCSHKYEIY